MKRLQLLLLGFVVTLASTEGLKCWRCGAYSDGVGSITPCANRSATKLEDCPRDAKYCIKYVSELTVVRDCVPTCSEKEWWGARTFCCNSDECNGASASTLTVTTIMAALMAAVYAR